MKWEEWLPDGLHPTHRGSYSYGQAVITYLESALAKVEGAQTNGKVASNSKLTEAAATTGVSPAHTQGIGQVSDVRALPAPLHANHWGECYTLPFSKVSWEGPWSIRRSTRLVWMDQLLETSAVGAKLSFTFEGRGAVFGVDFGKLAADFIVRLDGGEPIRVGRERPDWTGPSGWWRVEVPVMPAPAGSSARHEVELEVIHGNQPDCQGTTFRLAFIGILP